MPSARYPCFFRLRILKKEEVLFPASIREGIWSKRNDFICSKEGEEVMRIIIYTGKGGVGKTSIAAATAVRIAQSGKNVLLMSTDQAHSLRDSFDLDLAALKNEADGIVSVMDSLALLEININEESKKAWGELQDYIKQIIRDKANGDLAAEEALIFPGFEELFALLRILNLYEADQYDCLIVDCAPTGETLSLLRYPERLSVIADKILPMVRNVNKAFGGFISRKTSVPKPRDAVFTEFDKLVKRLNELRKILQNRDITSLRIVMSPERIVIDEARRSYSWLQIYDFGVDAVYVNRIYPPKALQGYFAGWAKMQEESLALVCDSFPEQKIFYLPMQEEEVRGLKMLEYVGDKLYGSGSCALDVDGVPAFIKPEEIFAKKQAFRLEDHDGTRWFIVHLPYAQKEELAVKKEGKELILRFRNETRRFRLPDKLVRRYVSGWDYKGGELIIYMDYE